MPVRRAFAMVEVLAVFAIVALVSGVVFAMSAGSREKARESSCMSNMHQIYTALALYSADNPGPEEFPGMGDIKLLPVVTDILPYVKSHDVFYCPNSTQAMKRDAWSTYEMNFLLIHPGDNARLKSYMDQWENELHNLGATTPIVICNIHDETYYAPAEQDIDADLAEPFQIHLQLDGSVKAGRFPGKRHRSFSL